MEWMIEERFGNDDDSALTDRVEQIRGDKGQDRHS